MPISSPSDNVVLALSPPIVNGQTKPVEGAHIGVSFLAYDLVGDGKGAIVLVDPPLSGIVDAGDVMELWLEGEPAALDSQTIFHPDVRTILRIPKGRLHPDKVNELYYTIRRGSSNLGTSAPPLQTLYNLTPPGGQSELKLLLPDTIKNGVGPDFVRAEVCVSYPYCRAHDVIILKCNGKFLEPKPKVLSTQAALFPGSEVPTTISFTITRAFLKLAQQEHKTLNFSYSVTDQLGNDSKPQWSQVQTVDEDLDGEVGIDINIRGSRSLSNNMTLGDSQPILTALDDNNEPLLVEWKYPSSEIWVTASTWKDVRPREPLYVRHGKKQLTVNPINITGALSAFVALRNDGELVGWGDPQSGGSIPSEIIGLKDNYNVYSSIAAFAALSPTGKVVAWGNQDLGGNMGNVDPSGFRQLVGNWLGFAGLKSSGSVVAWGDEVGVVPPEIAGLTDIVRIFSSAYSYAAQRAGGKIVTWGDPVRGGIIPPELGELTDIQSLMGNSGGYAGLRSNGQIVAWGESRLGGELPADIAVMTDIVELTTSNFYSFTARRKTGQLVAWGNRGWGGDLGLVGNLTDIEEVIAYRYGYVARRASGSVVTWGYGELPAEIGKLNDIVQVCASSQAFAAIRKDGTVVAWGDPELGGDLTEVADKLKQVKAIYGNEGAFVALTADGGVVTWGRPESGGDSSAVQNRLHKQVTYLAESTSSASTMGAGMIETSNKP